MTRKSQSKSPEPLHAVEIAPEFSRQIDVTELSDDKREFDLAATAEEEAALAKRFDVDGISNLRAHVVLTPFASGNKVALKARFSADVAQTCVVTLEPLTNRIEGTFFAEFVQDAFVDETDEIEFGADDDDPPEPIVDGHIEVGELIAQNLGLEIDPFPRAPGAVFEGGAYGTEDAVSEPSGPASHPFAVLERLKSQKN